MATLVSTSFTGTDGTAWPSPWSQVSASSSIRSNRGQQSTPGTGTWLAVENRANQTITDASIIATAYFSSVTNVSQRINLRWNPNTGNGYRLTLTPSYNGIQLMKVTAYNETVLQERFDVIWTATTDYKIRIEAEGSTIRARRWLASATEPATWDVSATDATYDSGDVSLVTVNMDTAAIATGNWDDVTVTTITSVPALAAITNPERGFFYYTETHELADDSGRSPLTEATLTTERTSNGRTLVFRYYVLEKYLASNTIDQSFLNFVAADLAACRAAGVKMILRFTYSTSGNMTPPYNVDPPVARVIGHIQQLAPTLNAYADIIDALQAGFIGMWGEWYYTDNFGDLGVVTIQQWSDRKAVVDTLLNELDSRIFVLIRYIGATRRLIDAEPSNTAYATRLGHHNDAFLADAQDWGTYETFSNGYTAAQNRTWLMSRNTIGHYPQGGESANLNPPRSDYSTAATEMSDYRWTFLNPIYHPDVLSSWGSTGQGDASARLGYRPALVSATVSTTSTAAGANVSVSVQIRNDGWAAPYRPRPWQVMFVNGSNVIIRSLPGDFRDLTPGGTTTITGIVAAPTNAGVYSVHLAIPDATPSLQSNPVFSVRLADTTWDAATGRNSLNANLTVAGTVTPTRVVDRWSGTALVRVRTDRWDGVDITETNITS